MRIVSGFQVEPVPQRFNMAAYALNNAQAPQNKPALLVIDAETGREVETWSYGALSAAVLRAAFLFRASYARESGQRILIRLKNSSGYAVAFFGAIAAGLVPVPVSPDLTGRELSFLLEDSEAAAILLDDSLPHEDFPGGMFIIPARKLGEAVANGPSATSFASTTANDPAFLVYTSGTTASPKGVLHAQRSAWGRRPMYDGWYGLSRQDRVLHAGSFNWTYTLGAGLTDPWANGATSVVCTGEKRPDRWPSIIREHHVTMFAAVPGLFRQILKYADVSPSSMEALRHGLCAGETLLESVAAEWLERTGTPLYQALGQTELSTYISTAPLVPHKVGRAGKPQPGRRVAILGEAGGTEPLPARQPGLLAVHRSDPALMLGYWRRPDEEATVYRGDWFIGGDAGFIDEDGYVAHLGRRNDLMNAGGFRVSPLEVEQEISRHPAVAEVAAVELEIKPGVAVIAAYVVRRDETAISAETLSAFASASLAAYKQPKKYVFVDALPRTANGKIKRSSLPKVVE